MGNIPRKVSASCRESDSVRTIGFLFFGIVIEVDEDRFGEKNWEEIRKEMKGL